VRLPALKLIAGKRQPARSFNAQQTLKVGKGGLQNPTAVVIAILQDGKLAEPASRHSLPAYHRASPPELSKLRHPTACVHLGWLEAKYIKI